MADRVGQEVGKYRLIRQLGVGGFAEVYLGEHTQLGTQAAIKLLHTGLLSEREVDQFRQEARTIANLIHPNIVRVLDFDALGGMPYLVMDYAPGGSLRQKYAPGTILPISIILPYVQQLAKGLQYAHDHKIIHRDIKPQNILIGRNEEILLGDFGISIVAETTSRAQQTGGFAGTVTYAAPEQIQGHPRPESDQYALAMVVYEWLTGSPAFTGDMLSVMWNQVHTPPPLLRSQVSTIPPAVEAVVLKALSKDPRDRYPSIWAFAQALTQASDDPLTMPPSPTRSIGKPSNRNGSPFQTLSDLPTIQSAPPQPTPRPSQKPPKIALLALLIAFLVVGSAAVYYNISHASSNINQPGIIDTATATSDPNAYTAKVPGLTTKNNTCDTGAGQWSIPNPDSTHVNCTNEGMTLINPTNIDDMIGEVFFSGPRSGYRFPQSYTISVDASKLSNPGCAEIVTRGTGMKGGYGFFICANGYWAIDLYDKDTGGLKRLKNDTTSGKTAYHLQVDVNGASQAFQVDGVLLGTITDNTYTSTDHVSLAVQSNSPDDSSSAVFSNFVYKPMP